MPSAITSQTTLTLPDVPADQLQQLAAQAIIAQHLGPGEELHSVKIDGATQTGLNSGQVQAVVTYVYWPAR